MIIASHESINGDITKLKTMFEKNSYILSEIERINYIDMYCSDKLKGIIQQ